MGGKWERESGKDGKGKGRGGEGPPPTAFWTNRTMPQLSSLTIRWIIDDDEPGFGLLFSSCCTLSVTCSEFFVVVFVLFWWRIINSYSAICSFYIEYWLTECCVWPYLIVLITTCIWYTRQLCCTTHYITDLQFLKTFVPREEFSPFVNNIE